MPTRNVVITDHQAALVERLVAEGRYQNASEVLREGLRLVERRDSRHVAKLQAIRDASAVGDADIAAGRYIEINSDEELQQYFANLGKE